MLFTLENINSEEIKSIQDFFEEFDSQIKTITPEEAQKATNVSKYINSLVSNCYQKSVDDIENTHVGNKITRKRNLKQAMRESFFYGANRFGNNFIA